MQHARIPRTYDVEETTVRAHLPSRACTCKAHRVTVCFLAHTLLSGCLHSANSNFPPYLPLLLLSARGKLTDHYCSKHMTPFWNDRICLLLSLKKSSDAIHNDNNTMFVIFTSTPHDICIKPAIICSRLGELSNKWRVICMKLVDISNRNSLGIWINDSQEGCVPVGWGNGMTEKGYHD